MPGTAAGAAKAREKLAARRLDPTWVNEQKAKRVARTAEKKRQKRSIAGKKGAETRKNRALEERPKPGKPLKGVKNKDLAPGKGEKAESRYWIADYTIHLRCGRVDDSDVIHPMRFPNQARVQLKGTDFVVLEGESIMCPCEEGNVIRGQVRWYGRLGAVYRHILGREKNLEVLCIAQHKDGTLRINYRIVEK